MALEVPPLSLSLHLFMTSNADELCCHYHFKLALNCFLYTTVKPYIYSLWRYISLLIIYYKVLQAEASLAGKKNRKTYIELVVPIDTFIKHLQSLLTALGTTVHIALCSFSLFLFCCFYKLPFQLILRPQHFSQSRESGVCADSNKSATTLGNTPPSLPLPSTTWQTQWQMTAEGSRRWQLCTCKPAAVVWQLWQLHCLI